MQRETVWLVEDEQGIADTLVYMLQQEGFAVEVFERGLPVLDKARKQTFSVSATWNNLLSPLHCRATGADPDDLPARLKGRE